MTDSAGHEVISARDGDAEKEEVITTVIKSLVKMKQESDLSDDATVYDQVSLSIDELPEEEAKDWVE